MTLQKPPRRTLLVDRDRRRSSTIRRILEDDGIEVVERRTLRGALAVLRQRAGVEALLLDVSLSKEPGLDPLARILEMVPTLPVVILADDPDEELTREAVRSGAQDYLLARQLDPTLVKRTVAHAVAIRRAEEEAQYAESMLLDCETRYQSLFDLSRDAICVVDLDGVVLDANQAAQALLATSARDIRGRHVGDLVDPDQHRSQLRAAVDERQPLSGLETTARHCDGRTSAALLALVPRRTALGESRGFYLVISDVADGTPVETLPKEGLYDVLTGLPNRSLFLDRLHRLMAARSRHEDLLYALLFIDLDDFEQVNHTLGHASGDELLFQVGGRLAECVRGGDTVARTGDDEFVVLLGEIGDVEDAALLADRLIDSIARPFQLGEDEIHLSCSVGITLGDREVTSAAELLRRADHAVDQARTRRAGTYQVYDRRMEVRIQEALRLDRELGLALSRNELTIRYQPLVRAETGQVDSFQALVHWRHARRGLVPGDGFLPTAEKLGLTHAMSVWVVLEVCRQLREWRERYPTAGAAVVSVPFSTAEFSRPDFLPDLESAVRQHGLSPRSLRLEVPASALALTAAADPAILSRIYRSGFRVSVVDFGIGPSSWLALEPTPVDRLKIHRSCLALEYLEGAPSAARLVAEMARRLGLATASEGVDTESQLIEARHAGSGLVQGRLFHEPLLPAGAEALLAHRGGSPHPASPEG